MMKHFYDSIQGWFDFQDPYSYAVERAPIDRESVFVEVGSWLGKSSAFMGTEILNSRKSIQFHCVDTWEGTPGEDIHTSIKEHLPTTLMETFLHNIEPVQDAITIHKCLSIEAAKEFSDYSIDFLWIDAGHTYEDVMSDLIAWFPKLKLGGMIGGHDYTRDWPGVVKAVNNFFKDKYWVYQVFPSSWIVTVDKISPELSTSIT